VEERSVDAAARGQPLEWWRRHVSARPAQYRSLRGARSEVTMNDEQADRLIELVERMADKLDDIAVKLDTIASNTGD
jgi:hypothetical protein